jgi:LPXTG-motif cell wall-anchored protein
MRALVRAAGITNKHKTKVGTLALGVGLTMLAGAFFAGPALAQQGSLAPQGVVMDHEDGHGEEPPACGDLPLPPCDGETPTPPVPTDTGEPPVDPPTDTPPTAKPSNVKTKPPADGGGGGNGGGGNQGGNNGGGGGGVNNDGPQLPATGAEAGLLAGLGAALVGGGAALVVLARRRRAALATQTGSDSTS